MTIIQAKAKKIRIIDINEPFNRPQPILFKGLVSWGGKYLSANPNNMLQKSIITITAKLFRGSNTINERKCSDIVTIRYKYFILLAEFNNTSL